MARPHRSREFPLQLLREQRYRQHFLRDDAKQNVVALVIVCSAYVLTVANDYTLIGDNNWKLRALSLCARALMVVLTGLTIITFRSVRSSRQWDRFFAVALVGTAVLSSTIHLTKFVAANPIAQIIPAGTLQCILWFAVRGPLFPRVIASMTSMLGAVVLLMLSGHGADLGVRRNSIVALVALIFIGIFSARSFEANRRVRFEAERRERQVRQALAREKERAEAMSHARAAFLAAMSHEFRTPMNAVIGLSDLLLDAPLANEHWRHVRTINESARGLLGMLNEILDFAKIDAQKLTLSHAPFDLQNLARSIIDMLRPQANKKSLDLILEMSSDIPKNVNGDDARIRQALVNIVSNAVKFTERGSVTLRIDSRPLENNQHEITFRVQDTGIGMAPDVLERLFRPFEQADATVARRYGGTGLGLSICKQIVKAMGGDIHVESEVGRGSVFSFKLPLEARTSVAARTVSVPDDRPTLSILVVDDNTVNREVARAKFGQLGYRIDLAADGSLAIDAVTTKDYDVVFMDLRMPEMTGIEATKRMMEKLAGQTMPHIVAMTASVFEEDREACRQIGMQDFVGKPMDMAQIDSILRRIADERGIVRISEMPNTPLVKETIDSLKELQDIEGPDFLATLVNSLLTDLENRFPRMAKSLEQNDLRTLQEDAHTLKSASGALGAKRMSELFSRLEDAAREARSADARTIFNLLTDERRVVERALVREIGAPT